MKKILWNFCNQLFLTLSTNQKEEKKMQKKWLEHFCKYRHICEFLGNEGKEKEEIKEYLGVRTAGGDCPVSDDTSFGG